MTEILQQIYLRHYNGSDTKSLRQRKSELTTAINAGLHEHVFDETSFSAQKANVPKNAHNMVKALCILLNTATTEELANMYLATMGNFDEAHEANVEDITFMLNHKDMPLRFKNGIARLLLSNVGIPASVKKDMLDRKIQHMREQNTSNRVDSMEKSRQKLNDGPSEKERKHWVHYRELEKWHKDNKDRVKNLLLNQPLSETDGKLVYFHAYLSINVFSKRTARADVAGVMIGNYEESDKTDEHDENLDSIFIDPKNQGLIIVNRGNKTRSQYTWDVTGIDPEVMKMLVERAIKMGSNYLFPPLRGKDRNVRYDSFVRTCVSGMSEEIFGRRLNTHLVRRIVATHDYQKWLSDEKGDLQAFIENAVKMDHCLMTHLQTYIYQDLFDPQLGTGVSTASI